MKKTMDAISEKAYKEREKRVNDAIQLKEPDRVPFFPIIHYYAAKYAGITYQEAWYNPDKWFEANKQVVLDLEPDLVISPFFAIPGSGQSFEAIDLKLAKWPGHGISSNHSHQFVEAEYMKAEEYDSFLSDPSDFALRRYLPRICGTLAPLQMLPPLQLTMMGGLLGSIAGICTMPAMAGAFKSVYEAGLESVKWTQASDNFVQDMRSLGFPMSAQAASFVPFDFISNWLRGMRGAMLDMYRQPDKLLKAIELLYPLALELAVQMAKISGNSQVAIAIHRGSDGFMSSEQFETYYWPTLKRILLDLINEGLTPVLVLEGVNDQRLHYLKELPKGKIMGMFDRTDVFKAKKILGDTMCIVGNVPPSLLHMGTPQKVKDYCKKLIDVVGDGGGFIMSSSTGMDDADPKLVRVWKEVTMEYGVYR